MKFLCQYHFLKKARLSRGSPYRPTFYEEAKRDLRDMLGLNICSEGLKEPLDSFIMTLCMLTL